MAIASDIDEMIPPTELNHVGGGDFRAVGEHFFKFFVELGGLEPHHQVLDVGCGIGRMAIPLTQYLSGEGSYEGFDIVKTGIDWCHERITPRYPNFRFRCVDIVNKFYNPPSDQPGHVATLERQLEAEQYRFDYDDASFDFVFLTSVFTHMLPEQLENYTSEIRRVLRVGGRALITFFLLNDESQGLLDEGRSHLAFPHSFGIYRLHELERPEHAVAYEEAFVRGLHRKHGMQIVRDIHYGGWCGRQPHVSFQDMIVSTAV